MTTVIEKFVAEVVWDIDPEGLEEFNKQADGVLKVGKAIAGVVAGAIGAFTGLAAVVNETTSRNAQLAKSVGITAESLEAYEGIFKRIGFEADNVVDLVEEMNNKLGELKGLKEMSSAQDALKLLNIEFKTLRDLEPEQQFEMILDAAKELEDRQIAVSAVDMLMGGEANKIVGYLRTYDDSLEDLIQRQKDLNLLTEEGRKGAERWAFVWGDMRTLVGSLIASFSGLLGEALAPLVEESIQWVIQNKELIKIKVRDWVEQVRRAIEFLVSVGKGVVGVTDSVGGLANALKILGLTIAALKLYKLAAALQVIITGLNGASVATAAFKAALTGLKTAGIVGLFVLAALALEDLYTTLTGGESAFAPIHDAIGKFLAEDVAAFVAGLLGMDPDELNLAIVEFFTQTLPDAYNWMVADFEAAIGIFAKFFTETLPDAYNWMVADFEAAITPFLDFFLKDVPAAYTSAVAAFEEFITPILDFFLVTLPETYDAAVAAFEGFITPILDFFLVALPEAYNSAVAAFEGFIAEAVNIGGGFVSFFTETIPNALTSMREAVASVFSSIGGRIGETFSRVYQTVTGWIRRAISSVKEMLRSIPGIGNLFSGGVNIGQNEPEPGAEGEGAQPPPTPPALPTPSVIVAQQAAGATTQTSSQQINFAPQMTVNQLPGEDGEAFANRVTNLLAEKAGEAVRNNDKGIVR